MVKAEVRHVLEVDHLIDIHLDLRDHTRNLQVLSQKFDLAYFDCSKMKSDNFCGLLSPPRENSSSKMSNGLQQKYQLGKVDGQFQSY